MWQTSDITYLTGKRIISERWGWVKPINRNGMIYTLDNRAEFAIVSHWERDWEFGNGCVDEQPPRYFVILP